MDAEDIEFFSSGGLSGGAPGDLAYGVVSTPELLEFFDVDVTDRQHRLRIQNYDWGLELQVIHGPKCEGHEPDEPLEVIHLNFDQMEALGAACVTYGGMEAASEAVALLLRDGKHNPELIVAAVLEAQFGLGRNDVIEVFAECRDKTTRRKHGSPDA